MHPSRFKFVKMKPPCFKFKRISKLRTSAWTETKLQICYNPASEAQSMRVFCYGCRKKLVAVERIRPECDIAIAIAAGRRSVSVVTGLQTGRWRNRGLVPGKGGGGRADVLSSLPRPQRVWVHPIGTGDSYLWVTAAGAWSWPLNSTPLHFTPRGYLFCFCSYSCASRNYTTTDRSVPIPLQHPHSLFMCYAESCNIYKTLANRSL
jgi:hypothetical protein